MEQGTWTVGRGVHGGYLVQLQSAIGGSTERRSPTYNCPVLNCGRTRQRRYGAGGCAELLSPPRELDPVAPRKGLRGHRLPLRCRGRWPSPTGLLFRKECSWI